MILTLEELCREKVALSLDDILLVPNYSNISSREEVDIGVDISCNDKQVFKLRIPFVAANMDTVCETEMAYAMWELGGIGVIHRYNTIADQRHMLIELHNKIDDYFSDKTNVCVAQQSAVPIAAAVGIKDYKERLLYIYNLVNMIFVDVAHGDHEQVGEALEHIQDNYPNLLVAAGNVATYSGAKFLFDHCASFVKVGVGNGSSCITRLVTGVGVPQASALLDMFPCKPNFSNSYIIADGGIKNSGDIAKSLALGADLVMIGSLFAGCKEAPGKIHEFGDGHKYKVYHGLASKDAMIHNNIKSPSKVVPEGVSCLVPYTGSVKDIIHQLSGGLKSALSYLGFSSLKELKQDKYNGVNFVIITSNGYKEGEPHVLYRERTRY